MEAYTKLTPSIYFNHDGDFLHPPTRISPANPSPYSGFTHCRRYRTAEQESHAHVYLLLR